MPSQLSSNLNVSCVVVVKEQIVYKPKFFRYFNNVGPESIEIANYDKWFDSVFQMPESIIFRILLSRLTTKIHHE